MAHYSSKTRVLVAEPPGVTLLNSTLLVTKVAVSGHPHRDVVMLNIYKIMRKGTQKLFLYATVNKPLLQHIVTQTVF